MPPRPRADSQKQAWRRRRRWRRGGAQPRSDRVTVERQKSCQMNRISLFGYCKPSMYTRLVVWHCNEGKGFLSESTVKIRHLNGSLIHCATRSFSSLWSEFYGITKPSCLLQAAVRAEIDKIGARPAGNVTQLPLIGEKT